MSAHESRVPRVLLTNDDGIDAPGLAVLEAVAAELAHSRRLFAERGWPTIDVTRRSIEETAAAIIDLYKEHRLKFIAQA